MYVHGMGRYRGMGQTELNCPGDIGCPGNMPSMIQNPLTPDQLAALSAANAAYFAQPQTATTAAGQSLTQWLNANSTAVLVAAGVLMALAVLK